MPKTTRRCERSDLANTIFTACIGYLITYAAKSTTEKVSRNRHGLDQDGIPFPAAEQPEEQGEPPDMR